MVAGLVVNKSVGERRRYLRKVQREIMNLKQEETRLRVKISYVGSISKSQARKLSVRIEKTLSSRRPPSDR